MYGIIYHAKHVDAIVYYILCDLQVGNCVARRNYRYFYLFLTTIAITGIYMMACNVTVIVLGIYTYVCIINL